MAQDDIQGQVVDAQGNPVDGAIVELTRSYQSSPDSRGDVFRTTTDSNGNYIFTGHQEGDGTTQEWHVSCYNYDGTAYVNSFNNPGVTADLPSNAIPDSEVLQPTTNDLDNFGGDTGSANINDTSPTPVDHNLSLKFGAGGVPSFLGSLSGLNDYPDVGERHTLWLHPNDGSGPDDGFPTFVFGHDSETERNNGYYTQIDYGGGLFTITRSDAGSLTEIDSTSVSIPNGPLIVETLHESDGSLTLDLYEGSDYPDASPIASLSGTDDTYITDGAYDSTGIGFRSFRDNTEAYAQWFTEA